jgi:hypothetical protein
VNTFLRVHAKWWALLLSLSLTLVIGALAQNWGFIAGTLFGSPAEFTSRDDPDLPGVAVPVLDSPHIAVGEADGVRYNSVPPTSGPHFQTPPAPGIYDEPLADALTIHALEHGHVAIQYAPGTDAATVAALRKLGAEYPGQVIVAPYPRLDHGIALTAWGRLDRFDQFDKDRIVRFIVALSGRYDHGWRGERRE